LPPFETVMRLPSSFICLFFVFGLEGRLFANPDSLIPNPTEKNNLRFDLSSDGKRFFQVTFLNQTWLRFNESNPGSTLFGKPVDNTIDIGLRRTRIQLYGQITNRTFLYFQFGQNNFNNTYAALPTVSNGAQVYGNRKFAAFFHDALCEFNVFTGKNSDALKIGSGLTIMNGLSRFSQPSISSIVTLDVPVFLQYSVDQIDEFDRRLAVYARGQLGKLDYRFYVSNPFPITSNGSTPAALDTNATFVNFLAIPEGKNPGIHNQLGGYVSWNFFDKENHVTPYMSGTYLGSKKILAIALGGVYQKSATWYRKKNATTMQMDTLFADMLHVGAEVFLDCPVNKEKQSAVQAFAGYYVTNYGPNYLRYNGLMNPATGFNSSTTNYLQKNSFGNAFPMFGTGSVAYFQFAWLFGKSKNPSLAELGQWMPFCSVQYSNYDALQHQKMILFDTGVNWLIKQHQSKISVDFQNRPTYYKDTNGKIIQGARKNCIILQYQIFI
jgi:hypothetical protein